MKTKLTRISKRTLAMILTVLMMFSMMIVGTVTASAANTSTDAYIYFDNTNTNWTGKICILLGRSSHSSVYEMQKVTGTNIYFKKGINYNDFTEYCFIDTGTGGWGDESSSPTHRSTYATHHTKVLTTTSYFSSKGCRLFVPTSSSDGCSVNVTNMSTNYYSDMNYIQTTYVQVDNGSGTYTTPDTSPATIKVSSKRFTGDTTVGTATDTTGTITAGSASSSCTADAARTTSVSYTVSNIQTGYQFEGWYAGTSRLSSATSYSRTITSTNTVYARFKKSTYTVTIERNPTAGGDVTIGGTSNPSTAQIGSTSVSIQATPKTGYQFTNWTTTGNVKVDKDTSATTTVTASGAGTLTANFEKIPCTVTYTLGNNVTYSSSSGGTHDSESKTITAYYGDTVSLTVDYAPGYEYDPDNSIIPSGATVSTDKKTFTFSSIKADKSITINAKQSAQTKSLTYYVDLHSNTPTANPTIKFGSESAVTLKQEGDSTVYSATVSTPYSPDTNEVVNPATITFNGNSYNVNIGDKAITSDTGEVWIESRGTLGSPTEDSFKVMSYASHESTFTVNGGTFSGISTKLYGTEGGGDADNVINGCGIITHNSDGSYTVKYAAEESSTDYGALSLRISFTTSANNDYYFDGWYTGGEKSDRYTSADAEIWLDGKNYELSYVEKTTWNVKVVYNYDLYDNSEKMYYDADYAQENDQHKTYTVEGLTFIEQNGERMSEEDSRERVEHNAPNLINDYYEYALISVPKTTDPDGYTVEYNESDKTCTITANLKKTVRMYTVTLNGQQYGEKQSYQALVKIQSGEVLGFNDNQNLIWSDDDKDVATGTSYSFRVTGDMHITARENTTGETFNGKSIIAHRSFDVNTALKELVHNFYIADFYNDSVGGRDSYVQFYGGGVLYFAMDKTTGKPTKATGAVDETGEAIKGEIEKVVERVASGEDNDYLDDQPNVTDDQTKIVCRYLNFDGHPDLFKYSDELQAYQYIYSAGILNDKDYSNYSLRVYSYFIYYDENSNKYTISVSDDYADANMYEAGK